MPELRTTIFLPPEDTVRVWQARDQLRSTVRWSEMIHEEHASAFTVAKIARLDLLQEIRSSLDNVIRGGGTFEEWKSSILPELRKAGWWGTVNNPELTGTDETIIVNDRRLRTIYRTNIRMSIAAGRWTRFQRQKATFPYLRYRSDHPRRQPRQNHLSWHGTILPVDHIWWQTHFPPNGWGCNCKPEQVSRQRLRRNGWSVSQSAPDNGTTEFFPAGRTQPVRVPRGIDPGFSYNPGTAHLRAISEKAMRSAVQAEQAGFRQAVDQTIKELVDDPAFDQFVALPNGEFPLTTLNGRDQAILGSQSRIVRFSEYSAQKQASHHPELETPDYRGIRPVLSDPDAIIRDGNELLYFGRDRNQRLWVAVLKVTQDKSEVYLVSARRASADNIRSKLRKGELVYERR